MAVLLAERSIGRFLRERETAEARSGWRNPSNTVPCRTGAGGGTWVDGGNIVAVLDESLYRIPATGGEPQPLTNAKVVSPRRANDLRAAGVTGQANACSLLP